MESQLQPTRFCSLGTLTATDCDELLELCNAKTPFLGRVGGKIRPNIRRCMVHRLDRLSDRVNRLTNTLTVRLEDLLGPDSGSLKIEESPRVLEYGVDDYFDWHTDVGNQGIARHRIFTFVIQLSSESEYGGGQVDVRLSDRVEQIPKKRGSITGFYAGLKHRARPVTWGKRRCLICWASY